MLAKVVSYGGNSVRYVLEKENAKTVKVNNMPDGLDPTAIWYMMKHHCQYHQAERTVGRKLERFMTTFVLSPSKEESANFTMEDWVNLQDEALGVLDSVGLSPNGISNEIKTNFTNSMNVGGLHSDSKSGTLHLHIDCCRVDMEGNTNSSSGNEGCGNHQYAAWLGTTAGNSEYAESGACGRLRTYSQRYATVQH